MIGKIKKGKPVFNKFAFFLLYLVDDFFIDYPVVV